jgi:hypothetical protein
MTTEIVLPFPIQTTDRVWVFQADKRLSADEAKFITDTFNLFLPQWQTHGKPLRAQAAVVYDHLLLVAADENFQSASGCSIDKLVNQVKRVGEELGIDFFNRLNVLVFKPETNETELVYQKDIEEQIKSGKLTPHHLVFNNTVSNGYELEGQWIQTVAETWLSRYF